ncbi:hypothetical protein RF11_04307 [Thelohanellus kitauei]|uniref:Uncharacterized protein n=1 Tax=Thelohanellus kitauei TaxID=669202 RepID=A0A0C2J2B5_THEKT|nr:hypothetical protein RF11_04307 [Thelohanellus kitauei]
MAEVHLNSEVSMHLCLLLKSSLAQLNNFEESQKQALQAHQTKFCIERRISYLLQIINILLSSHMKTHPELIHQLVLLKQNQNNYLNTVQNYREFQEELTNISTLVNFFEFKFTQYIEKHGQLNPTQIEKNITDFCQGSSIIISYSKPQHVYEFREDSTTPIFFETYLKYIYQNQEYTN